MNGDLPALINKYRARGILLDSNLLLLLYAGLIGPEFIGKFKRTANQGFTENEFQLLAGIAGPSTKVIVTPHILTETINYLGQLNGELYRRARQVVAETVPAFKERRPEARNLVKTGFFFDFGLTDSAVLDLPPKKYLVLSVDAKLIVALQKKNVAAINFNHLRQRAWRS